MNFIDMILKDKNDALKGAKQNFAMAMNRAIVKYDNERWITTVIMDEERLQSEDGSLTPELKRFRLKCNAIDIIELDRAQIEATEVWTLEKININAIYDKALKGQEMTTSAWFKGEPFKQGFLLMSPLAMALLYAVFPLTWMISGLLIAAVTSGWVKGKTAMERLPKNILIILFWPVWVAYIINMK